MEENTNKFHDGAQQAFGRKRFDLKGRKAIFNSLPLPCNPGWFAKVADL